jgi:hypothetical protein
MRKATSNYPFKPANKKLIEDLKKQAKAENLSLNQLLERIATDYLKLMSHDKR